MQTCSSHPLLFFLFCTFSTLHLKIAPQLSLEKYAPILCDYTGASNQISYPAGYRLSHATQCWPCNWLPVTCLYKIPLCQNKPIVHFCLFWCGIMNLLLSHKFFLRWSCSYHKNRDFMALKTQIFLVLNIETLYWSSSIFLTSWFYYHYITFQSFTSSCAVFLPHVPVFDNKYPLSENPEFEPHHPLD